KAERLDAQVLKLYGEGKHNGAIPLAQRALAIYEQVQGPQHPDVATVLTNLAELYRAPGAYGQAEPFLKRALAIREHVLGPEHPAVATSLHNLAALYQAQGNAGKAVIAASRGTEIREHLLAQLFLFALGTEARKHAFMATLEGETNATVSLHTQMASH